MVKEFHIRHPFMTKTSSSLSIHSNSQAAIARAHNNFYNEKSIHIMRRHNTLRKILKDGDIAIDYVKSKENLADPLTKGLARELVYQTSRGMGLKPINI